MVRILRAPLGRDGSEGVVVVGSRDLAFPSEDDRLLLSVGANQAGTVLRHWREINRSGKAKRGWLRLSVSRMSAAGTGT